MNGGVWGLDIKMEKDYGISKLKTLPKAQM